MITNPIINKEVKSIKSKKQIIESDIIDCKIMNIVVPIIIKNLKLNEIINENYEIKITKEELLLNLETKDINIEDFKIRISNLLNKQLEYTTDLNTKRPKFSIINILTYANYDGEKLVLEMNRDLLKFFNELKKLSKEELVESYSNKILKLN